MPLRALPWLLAAGLLGCGTSSAQTGTAPLLNNALALMVAPGTAVSDSDVAAAIQSNATAAQGWWNTLNTGATRTALWSDSALGSTLGARNTASMARLRSMALAWAQPGSPLYGNASLAAAIVASLDWFSANAYSISITAPAGDNWWDWEIGTPQGLNDCVLLMYGQLSAAQLSGYMAAVDHWVPDPTKRLLPLGSTVLETGANLVDKSYAVALRGALGGSATKLAQGRDAISYIGSTSPGNSIFVPVTSGDGFYADGSFIQHGNIAYTGSYGAVLIQSLSRLLTLLGGSAWDVTDPNAAAIDGWIGNSFLPLLSRGAVFDNTRGRAISRASEEGLSGRSMLRDLQRLLPRASALNAPGYRAQIKWQMAADQRWQQGASPQGSYFVGLDPAAIVQMKSLLADGSTVASAPAPQTLSYAGMQRVAHHRPGFDWSLSLFSPLISAFEYGNGENIKGWFTGVGMTALHTPDQSQYVDGYWATVDMGRLPGITTDRSASGTPVAWKAYVNPRTWVGGVALAPGFSAHGMDFNFTQLTGSALAGRKSWFAMGDVLVAVGSNITNTGTADTETIVDNRKIDAAGLSMLQLNGNAQPTTMPWSQSSSGVQTAYLDNAVAGAGIGYYFPSGGTLKLLRETRQGSWSAVNTGGPTTSLSRNYLSLALDHGVAPSSSAPAGYAYMVLPGTNPSLLASFAARPTVQVLSQIYSVHAVRDTVNLVTGAVFWNDASVTLPLAGSPWLTVNRKAAVLIKEGSSAVQFAVTDPTQANTSGIQVQWAKPASAVLSASPAITVTSLQPTLSFTVNTAKLKGQAALLSVAP